jgi:Immunity protein 35
MSVFDYNFAEKAVIDLLVKTEKELGIQLLISNVMEKDFGWVFLFDSKEYVETGNNSSRLAGNSPLIFDKLDGKIYITGTSDTLDSYIEQYLRGIKTPA